MALQIVAVNDAAPGACTDVGMTYDGSATITSTKALVGTSLSLSSTLAAGGTITLGAGADLVGSATSDITINSNKFTVAGATGNTAIAGTLAVTGAQTNTGLLTANGGITGGASADITLNTNKFTVDATNGNTVIAGTLTQTGAVGCAGSITLGAGADLIGSSTSDITINSNKFTVAGATGNTLVAGTFEATGAQTLTGITTHAEAVAFGGDSNAATSGAVAIPIDTLYDGYTTNSTAAIAATLADGSVGQMKIIKLETKDTNNMVVTPANFNNGTTLTFDATGEVALLIFIGTGWEVVYTTATVA